MAEIKAMLNKDYHADRSAISSSGLKLLAKSPKHFWAKYLDPDRQEKEPTEAMLLGSVVHSIVLELEKFECDFAVMPQGIDKRTKEGKRLWEEWQEANSGKTVVKQESVDIAKNIAKAIMQHPAAGIINAGIGLPEHTIFWEENTICESGIVPVKCKARLDYCVEPNESAGLPNGIIIDLKTTADCGEDFARSAYNLGYHIQAAFYAKAMSEAYGVPFLEIPFVFLAAEKESPFAVVAYKASEDFMRAGWYECSRLLSSYAQCKVTNSWPCYPETIQELNLPKWAKENYV